ncbi:MAG: response regulator [Planctomycetota bacterium]|nr:response regulator [Planctomycetota bacterium]
MTTGNNIPQIMVVDDEPLMGDMLTRFLSKKNFRVTCFTNPKMALESLKTTKYDLMLVDVHMPVISGVEVIKLGKGLKPDLPALVMTSHLDEETMKELKGLGISEYLDKPFDFSALEKMINLRLGLSQ